MNHHIHRGNRGYGVEWLQALFTLSVLTGIYLSSGGFANETPLSLSSQKTIEITVPYWNDAFGYGFQGSPGDRYQSETSSGADTVSVMASSGVVYDDKKVRVSFYQDATIDDIEKQHPADTNRAYSRLSNGIAVIEGDLASATAKMVLATLHSR